MREGKPVSKRERGPRIHIIMDYGASVNNMINY